MRLEELKNEMARLTASYIKDGQRTGQAYFNALHRVDPELANLIRTTDLDPFYRNERVQSFIRKVYEYWAWQEDRRTVLLSHSHGTATWWESVNKTALDSCRWSCGCGEKGTMPGFTL
jgi:hypothetical protein